MGSRLLEIARVVSYQIPPWYDFNVIVSSLFVSRARGTIEDF